MMKMIVPGALALLLSANAASDLSAQLWTAPPAGEERASFAVHFGVLAPMTTFEDDMFGESSFENGSAIGASATLWPMLDHRLGFRVEVMRSKTEGFNSTSEFAPIPSNDPVQWLFSTELIGRLPMGSESFAFSPSLSAGVGMKQYNWASSVHDESRFLSLTGAAGVELRPRALGPIGITAELRGYRSKFRAFGIDDGTWETGTPAREGTNIGFYGGVVGGVDNHDLLLTTGLTFYF